MKPLRGMRSHERLHCVSNRSCGRVEIDLCRGACQADGRIRDELVLPMARSRRKDRDNGRFGEHREAQRTLRDPTRCIEDSDRSRSNPTRDPVNLQGHRATDAKMLDKGQSGKRIVSHMDDEQTMRTARLVLNGARGHISFACFGDHQTQRMITRQERADGLPTGRVRGHEDEATLIRKGIEDIRFAAHDCLRQSRPL